MGYYSPVKKSEIIKFIGKWLEIEKKIILSEITQAPKLLCFLLHLYGNF